MSTDLVNPASSVPLSSPSAQVLRRGYRPGRRGAGIPRATERATDILLTAVGLLALGVLAGLAAAMVLIASQHTTILSPTALPVSFPGWMAGPLRGLWPGAPTGRYTLGILDSAALGTMYGAYVAAYACAPRVRLRWVVAALGAVHLAFFISPPLAYTDVFNYLNYGRMGVLYHLNPYTTIAALEPHTDATFAVSNWHHLLDPYGPLFTLLSYALAPIGVPASFWLLKILLAAASMGTLALVFLTARRLGRDPVRALVFVGLNPLVLVWGLGADHNDFLMVFLVMVAVYLVVRGGVDTPGPQSALGAHDRSASPNGAGAPRRDGWGPSWRRSGASIGIRRPRLGSWRPSPEALAGGALVAAVAIKASAVIVVPFLVLYATRRRQLLGGAAVAGVVIGATSLAAFGAHLPDLATQGRLVTHLGLPNVLGLALDGQGESDALRAALAVILVVTIVGGLVWAWRRQDWIGPATLAMLVLVIGLSWAAPWYVLWALPLAALMRRAHMRAAILVIGIYFLLAFMPSVGDLEHALHFRPDATPLGRQHGHDIELMLH